MMLDPRESGKQEMRGVKQTAWANLVALTTRGRRVRYVHVLNYREDYLCAAER